MGLPESFQTATVFLKACLIIAPLGLLLHIIGMSTTYWNSVVYTTDSSMILKFGEATALNKVKASPPKDITYHSGLWTFCAAELCREILSQSVTDWLNATRTFACFGLIAGIATVALVALCLFLSVIALKRIWHIVVTGTAFGTAVCILISVGIYGAEFKNQIGHEVVKLLFTVKSDLAPSWSFGLCVIAMVLYILSGCLLIVNLLKKRQL